LQDNIKLTLRKYINIYMWKLITSRLVGRPKTRWMDNVMKGIQAVKIVNWKR
jgi:hypothetical protein